MSPASAPLVSAAQRRRALVMLHLAFLLVSTSGLFGKWIGVGAIFLVVGRLVFALPTLALVVRGWPLWGRRSGAFAVPSGRIRWWIFLSGTLLAAHWVAFFHSVQISTVAVALLGYSAAPVFSVLLEPIWYRERFSVEGLGAAIFIAAGMSFMVEHWDLADTTMQGMIWGLLSGLTFSVLQLINRGLLPHLGSTRLSFYLDGVALVVLLPLLPFVWEWPTTSDVALMAIQGVFFTAVAHTLFIHALHSVRAQVVSMVSTLEPIYGILLAAWLLGEIPSSRTLVGGGLILVAVGWVTLRQTGWHPILGKRKPTTG